MPYDPPRTIASDDATVGALVRTRGGQLVVRQAKRGRVFSARVRFNGERIRVKFGAEWEGWTEERAQRELDYIVQQIQRGEWLPPTDEPTPASSRREVTTFQVFASIFLSKQAARLPGGKDS